MAKIDRRTFLAGSAAGFAINGNPGGSDPGKDGVKFRLGLVTYNIASEWDLPTVLKVCKTVGLNPVELRTTHKHGVEPVLSAEQRKEIRKRFADSGIELWGCGTVCEFQSTDQQVVLKNIEVCKKFIDLVADLGGKGVKVRPNGLPAEVATEKTLEQIGKSLAACGRSASQAGIEIWLEVHGKGTALPINIKNIMVACNHQSVGITWNSNPEDVRNGSVAESFEMLWPWIRSCHINDLYRDPLGYPYRELFQLLRRKKYDRVTLCEVGRSFPDPSLGMEFLRYYKAIWQEMNGITDH